MNMLSKTERNIRTRHRRNIAENSNSPMTETDSDNLLLSEPENRQFQKESSDHVSGKYDLAGINKMAGEEQEQTDPVEEHDDFQAESENYVQEKYGIETKLSREKKGDLKGNPPGVDVNGKTVIVSFTYKDADYQMKFKVDKPQEFKLKNLKTGESEKLNFYSEEKKEGSNPNSMDLFVNTMTVTKMNRHQGGAKDLLKLNKTVLGAKFIDLIKSALEQNPDFKVGIVGNVAVHDPEGGFDYANKGYNFTDQEDKKDISKFTQTRAENLKKDFFGDMENVEAYGINSAPSKDAENLKLSKPNEDANGATIYLKVQKTDSGSRPKF
jgi:hypothetical protein